MSGKQYGILIDSERCLGCRACEIACKAENDIPPGPHWIRVMEMEKEDDGRVRLLTFPMHCLHCGVPYCVGVCPSSALSKSEENGIVVVNKEKCIGCRMCLMVCPFGAPQFGSDGKMQKCKLCLQRVEQGLVPACAANCPAEAIYFGTLEELSDKMRTKRVNAFGSYLLEAMKGLP